MPRLNIFLASPDMDMLVRKAGVSGVDCREAVTLALRSWEPPRASAVRSLVFRQEREVPEMRFWVDVQARDVVVLWADLCTAVDQKNPSIFAHGKNIYTLPTPDNEMSIKNVTRRSPKVIPCRNAIQAVHRMHRANPEVLDRIERVIKDFDAWLAAGAPWEALPGFENTAPTP